MFTLDYKQEISVANEEPGRYVKHVQGRIHAWSETDTKIFAGAFEVFVIDVECVVNEQDSLFDALDYSAQTAELYSLYKSSSSDFKAPVLKALPAGDRWAPNMLYLARLEILPKYRGVGAGLEILRTMIQHFGIGCGIVVMKPYPLQFESLHPDERLRKNFAKYGLGDFDQNKPRATKKLQVYYGRLGFRKVRGTPYMVCDPYLPIRIASKPSSRESHVAAAQNQMQQ